MNGCKGWRTYFRWNSQTTEHTISVLIDDMLKAKMIYRQNDSSSDLLLKTTTMLTFKLLIRSSLLIHPLLKCKIVE